MSLTVIRRTAAWAVNAKKRGEIATSARFIRSFYARGDQVHERAEFDRPLNHGMNGQVGGTIHAQEDCPRHPVGEAIESGGEPRVNDNGPILLPRKVLRRLIGSRRDIHRVAL